jgi:hypothetical protein
MPRPAPSAAPSIRPGDVSHHEALLGANADHAEVRVQRRERVVGDFRAGRRDGADQRALAGVGQAEQADIGKDAQFEVDLEFFTLVALGALTRGAVGRRLEMGVAKATLAALGKQHLFVVHVEVGQHFAGVEVGDDGADRHAQHDVVATLAVTVGAAAVLAALAKELAGVAVIDQGIDVAVGNDVHAAALAAIATVGATHRDVFLAAESGDAVAAVASFNVDLCFVDELHFFRLLKLKSPIQRTGLCDSAVLNLFSGRNDGDRAALLLALDGELDGAILQREQGVVLAHADVFASVEFGTALTNDDVAGENELTTVALDAESLCL